MVLARGLPDQGSNHEPPRPSQRIARPGIDVVVPVHGAREHVVRCLESVIRHAAGDYRLVVIDDASTDVALARWLDELARKIVGIVLLRNERNLGFVASANRGLRHSQGRDVVLLNSDTIATQRFLTRLADCAYDRPDTGIVSPLSNNGTICSVPRFLRANDIPPGYSVESFAALVNRASAKERPELVTAVGFCMYVRADLIQRIGFLDEERFPRGYGEENDYSERAKRSGFRIRLCDDLFIAHVGAASFGKEGRRRQREHNGVMGRLHPNYHDDVRRFIRENPLADVQARIRRRLRRARRIAIGRRVHGLLSGVLAPG